MTESKAPYSSGPWQFALAILSEWHRTVATVIIVMLLGWPAIVIKKWGEDAGLWASLAGIEQTNRQAEHRAQDQIHATLAGSLQEQARISKDILVELKNHNYGAASDRQMLGYFTWKQCVQDNGKDAKICRQFQDIVGQPQPHH
jgi:hypothetical protein